MEEFLSTREVAKKLKRYGVGTSAGVRDLVEKGELSADQVGKKGNYRFRLCDVEEYVWARQGSRQLLEIEFFREMMEKVGPGIRDFFGDEPGCLVTIMPGGFIFSIILLSYLVGQCRCNVRLILTGQCSGPWDRDLINNGKVLLVDGFASTGNTLKKARQLLETRKDIQVKEIKTFAYGDFSETADFTVISATYQEHLEKDLQLNLKGS